MEVNRLIKAVKNMEIRGLGQASQEDRAFTLNKFGQILDLVAENRHRAMMTFQYHLIGRMDDMAHMKKNICRLVLILMGISVPNYVGPRMYLMNQTHHGKFFFERWIQSSLF